MFSNIKYTIKNKSLAISLIVVVMASFSACIKAPNFPKEPEIEFVSISKTVFFQNTVFRDSLIIVFSFTDGDGDLGDDSELNLYMTDSRFPDSPQRFRIPFIPQEGVGNGISGEVSMKVETSCCIYPDLTPPCQVNPQHPTNNFYYSFQIDDRAGNKSNIIRSPDLVMLCSN
jgi:hypothetical protein